MTTAREARLAALEQWNRMMADHPGLFAADAIQGASPPSVFVGSAGYPRVMAGPMVPPRFGDTALLDAPEEWAGKTLQEVVSYRLGLVRGIRTVPVDAAAGRYVQGLQDLAMGSRPTDADITFSGSLSPVELVRRAQRPLRAGGPHSRVEDIKR